MSSATKYIKGSFSANIYSGATIVGTYNDNTSPELFNKSGVSYPNYVDTQSGIVLWEPSAKLVVNQRTASSTFRAKFIQHYEQSFEAPTKFSWNNVQIHHMKRLKYGRLDEVSNLIPLWNQGGFPQNGVIRHTVLNNWWKITNVIERCKMGHSIIELLNFLYKNVSKDNPHILFSPSLNKYPLECIWNESVSREEIESFAKENEWYFPDDYKQLLNLHNGGNLFGHREFGGGIELLSLAKIKIILSEYQQIPSHCYPIAWTSHTSGAICVDSERFKKGNLPYLFFIDAIEHFENAKYINLSITEWLEWLIECQGREYWIF